MTGSCRWWSTAPENRLKLYSGYSLRDRSWKPKLLGPRRSDTSEPIFVYRREPKGWNVLTSKDFQQWRAIMRHIREITGR